MLHKEGFLKMSANDLFDLQLDCKRPVEKNERRIEAKVLKNVVTGVFFESR